MARVKMISELTIDEIDQLLMGKSTQEVVKGYNTRELREMYKVTFNEYPATGRKKMDVVKSLEKSYDRRQYYKSFGNTERTNGY